MLSFETCKKLKEAGFPRDWDMAALYNSKTGKEMGVIGPSLSKLIEAMPMRQKYLGSTVNDAHFVLRKLVGLTPEYRAYYEDEDTGLAVEGYSFKNRIAEEAVAQLWLALNEKK